MKKLFSIIALALSVLAISSCKNDEYSGIERWGEIQSFPDWFLNHYKPQIITRTLHVEFNEDAKADFQNDVILALYQVNDQGREVAVRPNQVQLFVNGDPSPDNKLRIGPDASDIEIGLLVQKDFLEENGPGMFNWKFKVLDNGGLDFINEFEVSGMEDPNPLLRDNTSMDVYHERVSNKPRVITDSSLLTILAILIAFIIIVQAITPKFTDHQTRKIFITVDGNRKNVMSMSSRKAKGAKAIILSGEKGKSQGFISKLFQGRDCKIHIKGLPSDIVLTPGKRFQSKANCNRMQYEVENAGDNDELKVIKGKTQDGTPVEVEYYAKKK